MGHKIGRALFACWAGAAKEASSFTADAFLEWALEQPVKRVELVNGRVAQYLPLSFGHLRAGEDVACALRDAIAAAGAGCEVFARGAGVRVDDLNTYEPDAVVCCGPSIPGDAVALVDPIIVVEIASHSTASTKRSSRCCDPRLSSS